MTEPTEPGDSDHLVADRARERRRVPDRDGRVGLAVEDEDGRLDSVGECQRRKCPELAAQLRAEGRDGSLRGASIGRGQEAGRCH